MIDKIKGTLFGLAAGDALGVPVEFRSRDHLKIAPVKDMVGYGTWNQPPGTWSDDSSLAFCLSDTLTKGYDVDSIAQNFIAWMNEGYWGAHHKVFDVGNATSASIARLMKGVSPVLAGGMAENDNGNGSLMRIMPLLFYIKEQSIEARFERVKEVSSLTHAHFRSVISCFICLEMAIQLLNGYDPGKAYSEMKNRVNQFSSDNEFNETEMSLFSRILKDDIKHAKESSIKSGGYVLDTLEASIWCLLNTESYAEAVLKAVNLGGDTDTTGCVTGALAGLRYGYEAIPQRWVTGLARAGDIDDLCERLYQKTHEWKNN